jgi:uncharacterized linocin/CFP29 family protein
MNNLHRELAPISAAAWASIEEEARRTARRHLAGRRAVEVRGPGGETLSAVGTGHADDIEGPADGVSAWLRRSQPVVRWRVPFTVSRSDVDDVERGAQDADWQAVKDAARAIAFAEDRAIFEGYAAARITGIRQAASNAPVALPAAARDYPAAVSQAVTALRLAGVDGPYLLLLSAAAYAAADAGSEDGYPVREHLARVVDGEIIWAPAIDGAFLLSGRGGDFVLHLGQDTSIGYLAHDDASIRLYLQESLTFQVNTAEAAVPFTA